MSESLLDKYFPRKPQPEPEPQEERFPGVRHISNIPWQPERKKAKRGKKNKYNGKYLEKIGEGLTRDVLEKFGITLLKIPLRESYYGYSSIDVDFQGTARAVKVEAKAWWIAHNTFALSRFSKNERGYLNKAMRGNYETWITIALLDTEEPSRTKCYSLYVIPWARWLEIESELAARASGNFKGKSLRRKDLDLIEGYQIVKVKRRWVLPDGHWLSDVSMEEKRCHAI